MHRAVSLSWKEGLREGFGSVDIVSPRFQISLSVRFATFLRFAGDAAKLIGVKQSPLLVKLPADDAPAGEDVQPLWRSSEVKSAGAAYSEPIEQDKMLRAGGVSSAAKIDG